MSVWAGRIAPGPQDVAAPRRQRLPDGRSHGKASHLSAQGIEALSAYLRSLQK